MAKKTQEQILAERAEKTKLVETFQSMPIEKWSAYIKKNAPKGKENRRYRVCAKKALTIENMVKYISTYNNTEEAKHEFKEASYGVQYEKIAVEGKKGKEFKKDENGNYIPILDKNGEPVKKQSVVYAVDYFVNHYLDGLLVIEETKQSKAFDLIKDW